MKMKMKRNILYSSFCLKIRIEMPRDIPKFEPVPTYPYFVGRYVY